MPKTYKTGILTVEQADNFCKLVLQHNARLDASIQLDDKGCCVVEVYDAATGCFTMQSKTEAMELQKCFKLNDVHAEIDDFDDPEHYYVAVDYLLDFDTDVCRSAEKQVTVKLKFGKGFFLRFPQWLKARLAIA